MEEYEAFTRLIKSGAVGDSRQGIQTLHTVAISSLMYPPKLAWMRDDGPSPINGYVNQREKIDWLNGEISRLNHTNLAVNPPGIHTYGIMASAPTPFPL